MIAPVRLAVVGLVTLSTILVAGEPPELRWRLKKGQSLKYQFRHQEERTAELGDQEFKMTTQTELEWQWLVRDVDAGGVASLEMKLTAVRMEINGKSFDFSYNSGRANTADDDYKKRLINLLDQVRYAGSYTVRLKADGQVVEVRGLSKILDDTNPGLNILDYHGLNLRDDTFAWYLQQALGRLPGQTKQEKWQAQVEGNLAGVGALSGRSAFALQKPDKEADRRLRHIACEGTQSVDLDMKWLGVPLKGTLAIDKIAGGQRFDATAGALQRGEADIHMRGDLKFGGGEKPAIIKLRLQHKVEVELQP